MGHQHAEHEVVDQGDEHFASLKMTLTDIDSTSLQINMVIPYIFESRLRVKENAWKCVNHTADYGNRCVRYYQVIFNFQCVCRDEFWEATGDYILKRGNYCATHPLAKNSF